MSFRRLLTVLTVVLLFAGLAAAQTQTTQASPLTCNTVAQVTPTLRVEGLTELVGDIVITCTGGAVYVPTTQNPYIPTANITVSLTNKVTSRLLDATTKVSEALLLIDEPGSTLTPVVAGFGPAGALKLCPSPQNPLQGANTGSCQQLAQTQTSTAAFGSVPVQVAVNADPAATTPYNAWSGTVVGTNQILFQGIPVLPPATANISRVYRITNVRIAGGGALSINGIPSSVVTQVFAYLSNSGSTSLPVSSAAVTVGFVQSSMVPTVKPTTTSFAQCITSNSTPTAATALAFTELFPSAFKTRLSPVGTVTPVYSSGSTATTAGPTFTYSASGPTQNVPGQLISSESGFIVPANTAIGLADTGTRLQAKFAALPKGVDVYVTRTNVVRKDSLGNKLPIDMTAALVPSGWWEADQGSTGANVLTATYAELTTKNDNNAFSSYTSAAAPTTVVNGITLVKLSPTYDSNNLGTATATWEVLNSNSGTNEQFTFGVYIAYTPAAGTPSLPLVNTNATASLNYGSPSSIDSATVSYNAISGAGAYIPRFAVGGSPAAAFNIVPCSTVLLFPYVTTDGQFNTGMAISNTSKDPLGTATSNNDVKCTLTPYGSWYASGVAQSVAAITAFDVNVAPGQTTSFLASDKFGAVPTGATGFTGYVFAQCNFQFAHGFAFITNVAPGAGNLGQTMGYLALIVNNGNFPVNLRAGSILGEALNN